ncbi:MAG: DNA internalization-related competence protein ComEC/Rec2 [Xanthomonadales bacterium]|nr:DNA internalization-related competence protein ComEC/Rec2 [Xanthomonadales bacterium]
MATADTHTDIAGAGNADRQPDGDSAIAGRSASASTGIASAGLGTGNLLAFAAGVCSLWLWPTLPDPFSLVAAVMTGLALMAALSTAGWLPAPWRGAILHGVLGMLWGIVHVGSALEQRLPAALEGEDLAVVGQVRDLPRLDTDALRFVFCPEHASRQGEPIAVAGCWRLGWYLPRLRGDQDQPAPIVPDVRPGQRWQLTVRLKRPHGLHNPGGFDSERKALETGISAVGYVRDEPDNRPLTTAGGIDALRGRLADSIDAAARQPRMASLLRGLAVGDRRDFSEQDWRMLRRTGVGHLFSISGLHVGMVAIFAAALVTGLTWLFPAMLRCWPRRYWALAPALLAAWGYALLAGFEVPTRRTMAMIAAAGLALLLRRRVGLWHGWALALALILLADPLAMTSIGFWLSYLGVAWLLIAAQGRHRQGMVRTAVQAQWAVSIGLLPIGIGFFAQASWVSPLVNLIAIPWITLAVVPLLLLSLPMLALSPTLGAMMVVLAERLMVPLIVALDKVSDWQPAAAYLPEPGLLALVGALLAAILVLLPVPAMLRWLVLPLLAPLLLPGSAAPAPGKFELDVLDVGQGTAVLVRTHRHALLFDTGARYPNGFDIGQAVVVPALQALAVRRLDALVVSHADNDHAGGAAAVIAHFPVARVLLGEPVPDVVGGPCHEPETWQWDGVEFQLLHPPSRYPVGGNEVSCVLRIVSAHGSALLTGDAGKAAEMRMLNLHRQRLPSQVLLLGHHGSRHSSTAEFLDAVQPALAIASAGYRNRYRHPQPEVLARLAARDIDWLQTPDTGALQISFGPDGPLLTARRQSRPRLWHAQP